jgi:hypothetical protein
VTAAQVIEAYRQIVTRAHARGVKVIGATILPYKGAVYFTPEGEAMRQAVNAFIRTGGLFDRVIDFEKAAADPADPARIDPVWSRATISTPTMPAMPPGGRRFPACSKRPVADAANRPRTQPASRAVQR